VKICEKKESMVELTGNPKTA